MGKHYHILLRVNPFLYWYILNSPELEFYGDYSYKQVVTSFSLGLFPLKNTLWQPGSIGFDGNLFPDIEHDRHSKNCPIYDLETKKIKVDKLCFHLVVDEK